MQCPKVVVQRCSVKKVFLEISPSSQKNSCTRVSFLIKLQASGSFLVCITYRKEFLLQCLFDYHCDLKHNEFIVSDKKKDAIDKKRYITRDEIDKKR